MDEVSLLHTRLGLREQVAMPVRGKPEIWRRQARDELFPRNPSTLSHVNSSQTLSESQDVFIQIYRFFTYVFSQSRGKIGEDKQWKKTLHLYV